MNSMDTSATPKKIGKIIRERLVVNSKMQHQRNMAELMGFATWNLVGHNMTRNFIPSDSLYQVGKFRWKIKGTV